LQHKKEKLGRNVFSVVTMTVLLMFLSRNFSDHPLVVSIKAIWSQNLEKHASIAKSFELGR